MQLFPLLRRFMAFIGHIEFVEESRASRVKNSEPTPLPSPVVSTTPTLPSPSRRFATPDTLARLPKLARRDLDALPFGCVRVGDDGRVLSYNKWESELAGVPQEDAIGRNFFRELAPCTNNRLVFGRFKDGVRDDELDTVLTYSFTYKMRPTLVDVHLYRDTETQSNWVLVRKSESGMGK